MKKKNKPILSEEYVIHFQYEEDGITKRSTYSVKREFKGEHDKAEKQFLKETNGKYKKLEISKVVYQ